MPDPNLTPAQIKKLSEGVRKDTQDKKAQEEAPNEELSFELKKQREDHLSKAQHAREQREQPQHYFDGMTYLQDYQSNEDAANTYLRPKKNKADVRVNTATSEKKLEAMMNEMLSMNIQHEVRAFDNFDNEIKHLGKDLEDIVTRTNEIEREEPVWEDAVRELITQRALFVKEEFDEREVTDKRAKSKKHAIRKTRKRVISGRKVYLGDITLPAYRFNEQPYIIEVDVINKQLAKSIFGNNPNWGKVKPGGKLNESLEFDSEGKANWRMNDVKHGMYEVVRYYSYPDDEYQIYLNGVQMFGTDEPLPWEWEGYNITMVTVKPIASDFAYGKSPMSSAKGIQSLENETIRNLIYKMRQGLQPPTGTRGKKVFSKNIWDPGSMTQGVDKNTFSKLVEHDGVSNADMAMFHKINDITEEFIGVSRVAQGLSSKGTQTATENLNQLRQSIKMMGLAILALLRLRINVTYLRIFNTLENHTKPVGKKLDPFTQETVNKFMSFTLRNTDLGFGQKGTRKIMFTERNFNSDEREQIFAEEERQKTRGNNIRLRTINVKELKNIPLIWYVTASQQERQGSEVDKLMINEKIAQAASVEKLSQGQVRTNWQSIADDMATAWSDKDLFQTDAPDQIAQGQQQGQVNPEVESELGDFDKQIKELEGGSTGLGQQLTEASRQQTRLPSTVEAAGQAV